MSLVGMSLWIFLLITAIALWAVIFYFKRPDKTTRKRAVKLGLFLLVFDFVFENIGYVLGLWEATGSIYRVIAPPIEVVGIALLAGYTYSVLFPKKFDWNLGLASSLLIAVTGVAFESILIGEKLLAYTGWWDSYFALVSYFVTFLIMHKINSVL